MPRMRMPRTMERASNERTEANLNTMHTPTRTRWGSLQRSSAHMIAEGDSVNSAQPAVNGGIM